MSLQAIRASDRDDQLAPEMLRNFAHQCPDVWERIVRLAVERSVPPESVAAYALLLGEKIVSAGLDSDDLLAALRHPGEGLDLPLIMAKRKTRGERVSPRESLGASIPADRIDWPEDYGAQAFDESEFDHENGNTI